MKRCRVAFVDSDGVEHAVELDARSLYEAVWLAIDRFRRCEHVSYHPQGMHEFIVESREPSTQHRLTRNMFNAWLQRPGGSPADVARKSKLKGLLGDCRVAGAPATCAAARHDIWCYRKPRNPSKLGDSVSL